MKKKSIPLIAQSKNIMLLMTSKWNLHCISLTM